MRKTRAIAFKCYVCSSTDLGYLYTEGERGSAYWLRMPRGWWVIMDPLAVQNLIDTWAAPARCARCVKADLKKARS